MAFGSTGMWRTILAFVAGPLAGAAVIAAIYVAIAVAAGPSDAGSFTLLGDIASAFLALTFVAVQPAAATAVFLGIPAFLLLRRFGRLTAPWCAFTGGVLASVPATLYLLSANPNLYTFEPSRALMVAALLFVGGAVGGLLFWRIQRPA